MSVITCESTVDEKQNAINQSENSREKRSSVFEGDCREILKTLPTGSIHCCVTSPPYWGLRDYGLPPVTWGGQADCSHEWAEHVQPAANGIRHAKGMTGPTLSAVSATRKPKLSNFCQKCGAWKGQLGLEPTSEMYVEHLVEVFKEVHRVLREDGVLWLNLGDSYYGSWGNYASPASTSAKALESSRSDRYGTFRPPMAGAGEGEKLKPKDLCGMPWRVALALQSAGYYLRCDVIWAKPNPMPESVTDRPTRSHEYLFMLTKSARYYYDAEAVKEPFQSGRSDVRKMLGKATRIGGKHKDLDDASTTTNIGPRRIVGRNRRSVWTVPTVPYKGSHFATFPPKLVSTCILATCPPDGTVLDPFAGSGTTGAVALELGRRALLLEHNPDYIRLIEQRCGGIQVPEAGPYSATT